MFRRKRASLPELCVVLADAVRRRDGKAFGPAYEAAVRQANRADVVELSAGVATLAPALAEVPLPNGNEMARLAGGLVEMGADPGPVIAILAERVAHGLELAGRFPARWRDATGEDPPDPDLDERLVPAVRRIEAAQDRLMPSDEDLVAAWFTVGRWIPGLLVPLQVMQARRALPQELRARLLAAIVDEVEPIAAAQWLTGLLTVLDDEPLIVLHRAAGTGFQVTIGGIGDNFQLHTLLAAELIGQGLVPGEPLNPMWIAAARDGDPQPPGGIRGQFNLVDAFGGWIWNEGRPVDIPFLEGRRVVVLDPPPYERSWNAGRVYPLMRPSLVIDQTLPPAQAAEWMSRIKPPTR